MKKVRLGIQLNEDLRTYVDQESERLGISASGFLSVCISQYREYRQSLSAFSNMQQLMEKVESLQADSNK